MMELERELSERLASILEEIEDSCTRCGRSKDDVVFMAVTKTKPAEVIQTLMNLGVRVFGENYPDETIKKIDVFANAADDVQLCMIGTLQSRKAKIITTHFDAFHSVDSLKTAERVDQLLSAENRIMEALIEINVGGESSKHGWDISQTNALFHDLERILSLKRLKFSGLMTLPPYTADGETNRAYFAMMRELLEKINRTFGTAWQTLSMGTSDDFPVAIEEGATIVRIGTKLVGARSYRN